MSRAQIRSEQQGRDEKEPLGPGIFLGLARPIVPDRHSAKGLIPMAGYSQTPLWKKLGYKNGGCAWVEAPPSDYISRLGLPAEVKVIWLLSPKVGMPFVHLFVTAKSRLKSKLRLYRKKMAVDGVVWVSWPKKSSRVPSEITEDLIREVALPLGLVDIKVCAVDAVWSGLKLMIRKELR